MPYAEQSDIVATHGQDLLETVAARGDDDAIDATAVSLALESASSEIDSYLSMRYTTPIAAPTRMVKQVCVDIAVYRLAYTAAALTEEMRKRYEDAIAWLRSVAKGEATVIGAEPPASDGSDGGSAAVTGNKRAGMFYLVRG